MDETAYRSIFESSPDPMWFFNESTLRFIEVNRAAEEAYGYTREEFLSMTVTEIRPPEDVPEMVASIAPQGEAGTRVWRHLRKDGQPLEVTIFSTPTTFGGVPARAVTVRDVTEQNRARRALADLNAALDAILFASPASIISLDADARIVTSNPAAEELMGVKISEAKGRLVTELFSIDEPTFRTTFDAVLRGRTVSGIQLSMTHPSGEGRHLLMSAAPLFRAEVGVTGAVAILLDVTESVLAHRDLEAWSELLERRVAERTAELVAANEELEGFCASVSHDLRSPLRAIDGFSKALIEDYGEAVGDTGRDFLHRVRAAALKMSDLIDDLLGLTRLTRAPLHRTQVDACALAQEVMRELRQSEPERKVEFNCHDSAIVYGDSRQIKKLLETLLENAWKFTSKTEQPVINLTVEEYDDETVYSVSDNGAGFDMEYVSKLFKPFERLHRATDYPGNGIGLATAHRIVTRHGGRIWAEGMPGEGAVIRFTLDTPNFTGSRHKISSSSGRAGT